MLYATPADLLARYAERDLRHITDADGQAFVEQRAVDALADASVEIDAYVGQRYLLPLQQPVVASLDAAAPLPAPVYLAEHPVLKRCACDIAVYRLQTLRPADDIKDARQRYEDVIKLLVRIGKGEVLLEGAALRSDVPDAPTGMHSAGMPIFDNPPSVWAREYR